MEAIAFAVNDRSISVAVDPATPLLHVLRNDLSLKGTRAGCGEGQCLACTVLVDGRPQTACNLPVSAVAGRKVETVEILSDTTPPHVLLTSILTEQAGQCGYCLAGILMRAKALLASHARPTRGEITSALDGHLCRCGAHTRIIRAIERAAARERQA